MYKVLLLTLLSFMFSACMSPQPEVVHSNQKTFEEEDAYILFALRAEQLKEYDSSSSIFNTLYEKSDKKEYFYRSLQNDLAAKKNQQVIQRVDDSMGKEFNDFVLIRIKIIALIQLAELERAKENALKLVSLSNTVDDYILVSDIYIKQEKYDTAIKYLESAYTQDYNEKVLDKMAIILYVNLQRKKDAIAQLETHTMVHGCSKLICSRLISFYSNENNIDGLLSAYLRLYKIDANPEIAKRIVQIYGYKKEHIKLMSFLEESKSDNRTLLEIYISLKNYKKAFPLADELYQESGEVNYLGQSAIFEYESSEDKNNKEMLSRVTTKLEYVVQEQEIPLYLNYLGYLMIDHSLDVKEGMKYVQMALSINPNSAYYLDSLAWGYYRLGNCSKADSLIEKVLKLKGGDEPEVLEHAKSIKECNKINRGKKKK